MDFFQRSKMLKVVWKIKKIKTKLKAILKTISYQQIEITITVNQFKVVKSGLCDCVESTS